VVNPALSFSFFKLYRYEVEFEGLTSGYQVKVTIPDKANTSENFVRAGAQIDVIGFRTMPPLECEVIVDAANRAAVWEFFSTWEASKFAEDGSQNYPIEYLKWITVRLYNTDSDSIFKTLSYRGYVQTLGVPTRLDGTDKGAKLSFNLTCSIWEKKEN